MEPSKYGHYKGTFQGVRVKRSLRRDVKDTGFSDTNTKAGIVGGNKTVFFFFFLIVTVYL